MKKFLIPFIFLLALTVIIVSQNIPKDKLVIILRGEKSGDVIFDHTKHLTISGVTCTSCHHKFESPTNYKSCRTCHGVQEGLDKPIKVFHKLCLDCHKQFKDKSGVPRKCKECHSKVVE